MGIHSLAGKIPLDPPFPKGEVIPLAKPEVTLWSEPPLTKGSPPGTMKISSLPLSPQGERNIVETYFLSNIKESYRP